MALVKQPVQVNFSKGVNTKTDPYQVPVGQFLSLTNSVFTTEGRLTKRNGYADLTMLPNALQTTLTTLNDNLIATGSNLYSFNSQTDTWQNQGIVQPVSLSVQSIVRSSLSQTSPDCAVEANGLTCVAYVENSNAYYMIVSAETGQAVVQRTALPSTAVFPRTYVLGRYFVITFLATVSATTHLQYVSIPISNVANPNSAVDISTSVSSLSAGYDGYVANNNLYLAWAGAGTTVKIAYLTSTLTVSSTVTIASHTTTLMSVTADTSGSNSVIWIAFWDSSSTNGYVAAFDHILNSVLSTTQIITTTVIEEITSVATNGLLTVFYENSNTYQSPYPTGGVETEFVSKLTVTQSGTVGATTVPRRSVGLATKAFIGSSGTTYVWVAYGETNQPTYFLIDGLGNVYAKLAYANGGGYASTQVLPSINVVGSSYVFPYLFKDFLATTNKGLPTNAGGGVQTAPINAIFTNTGVNLCTFEINTSGQFSSEIASALHLTGGQVWEYDGVKPVEHGFHIWPENVAFTTSTTGGNLTAQVYYYVFTYEWTDNQGLLHRSAPSIPLLVDIHTSGTSTNENTLYVPTLRVTQKGGVNNVRIVGYRWSTAQQVYYQFTSLSAPTANDPTVDFVIINDTLADSSILGNTILYTTGGVIENIAAPACIASTMFDDRVWLIDAEDQNLLWFSKQVIEATPVEFSDLLTMYIAPSIGAQNSTGPLKCLAPMDDKIVLFKADAMYYVNGTGPDNTGSNSQYSQPVFISAAVGSTNQSSIVLTPDGLMFQSDKGIWLLGRDLSTSYVGAPVEVFNSFMVTSAQVIPGTTQVRFVLSNGTILMYDYFFKQWGTFTTINAVSATLYNGMHTYLNEFGAVFQETPGTYTDGSNPVLMSFITSWMNVAGLRGYERFYFFYLLGTYFTPFKLNIMLAYDWNASPIQNITVSPDNFAKPYGGEQLWGNGVAWGGPGNVFQARVFPQHQKCQTFQVGVQEVYDATLGVAAGQGLSLSGMNLVIGVKKGYSVQKASRSFG